MGEWFSGDWYSQGAKNYIAQVQQAYNNKTWNTYGAGSVPTFPANPPTLPPSTPQISTMISPSQPSPTAVTNLPTPTFFLATPTLYCLGSCPTKTPSIMPTNTLPSVTPVTTKSLVGSIQPSIVVSTSPQPLPSPHKLNHYYRNGPGLIPQLFALLIQLLNLLSSLFGK